MKLIPLTQGKTALVDDCDFDRLMRERWVAMKPQTQPERLHVWYAYTRRCNDGLGKRRVLMHREITGAPRGMDVDHKDNDGLNNQRSNLRVCTRSENLRNSRKRKFATSRFKGVEWDSQTNNWRARAKMNGKKVHLGRFSSEIDAAKAYDAFAVKNFGEFARPNL